MENIVNYLATNKPDYNEIMEQFISENIKDQMEMDRQATLELQYKTGNPNAKIGHSPEKQLGLIETYRSIAKNKVLNYEFLSLKDDLMILQLSLNSKCPYPSAEFRSTQAVLTDTNLKTTPYEKITDELMELNKLYDGIKKMAKITKESPTNENISLYLDAVLNLKYNITKIHPFQDGNGRIARALTNGLLAKVGLPPVAMERPSRSNYTNALKEVTANKLEERRAGNECV